MNVKSYRQLFAVVVSSLMAIAAWDAFAEPEKTRQEKPSAEPNHSDMQLSGEEAWSMNCQRCHNIRPPAMYSNAQWEVIVHHMRVRANITGAEQRAILEFLKSSK